MDTRAAPPINVEKDYDSVVLSKDGSYFPITTPLHSLTILGVGTVLYFRFHKYILVLMSVFVVLGFFVVIYEPLYNASALPWGDLLFNLTLYDLLGDRPLSWLVVLLDLLCCLVMLFSVPVVESQVNRFVTVFECSHAKAADYTVQVDGLPRSDLNEDAIRSFFSFYGDIAHISCPVAAGDLIWAHRKQHHAERKCTQYKSIALFCGTTKGCGCFQPLFQALSRSQRRRADKYASVVEKMLKTQFASLGRAYITFHKEASRISCSRDYRRSIWQWIAETLPPAFRCVAVPRRFPHAGFGDTLTGMRLTVKQPSAPEAILWENLEVTSFRHALRVLCTLMVAGVLIGAESVIVFFLRQVETSVHETALSYFLSLVVGITSALLRLVIDALADWERHTSTTGREIASIKKRFWLNLFNSVFVIVVQDFFFVSSATGTSDSVLLGAVLRDRCDNTTVEAILFDECFASSTTNVHAQQLLQHWYAPGQLVATMFHLVVINVALAVLFECSQWVLRQGAIRVNERLFEAPQPLLADVEASDRSPAPRFNEHPRFSASDVFVVLMHIALVAFVFAPVLPMVALFTTLSLLGMFWLLKALLLRVYRRPLPLDSRLTLLLTPALAWIVLGHMVVGFLAYFVALQNVSLDQIEVSNVIMCAYLGLLLLLACYLFLARLMLWPVLMGVSTWNLQRERVIQDESGGCTQGILYQDVPGIARYEAPVTVNSVHVAAGDRLLFLEQYTNSFTEKAMQKEAEIAAAIDNLGSRAMFAWAAMKDRMFQGKSRLQELTQIAQSRLFDAQTSSKARLFDVQASSQSRLGSAHAHLLEVQESAKSRLLVTQESAKSFFSEARESARARLVPTQALPSVGSIDGGEPRVNPLTEEFPGSAYGNNNTPVNPGDGGVTVAGQVDGPVGSSSGCVGAEKVQTTSSEKPKADVLPVD